MPFWNKKPSAPSAWRQEQDDWTDKFAMHSRKIDDAIKSGNDSVTLQVLNDQLPAMRQIFREMMDIPLGEIDAAYRKGAANVMAEVMNEYQAKFKRLSSRR